MSKGKIVHAGNYAVEVEEGKTYYWCQCGESSNQPFCDGSHINLYKIEINKFITI